MNDEVVTDTAVRWRRAREGDLESLAWLVGRMSPLLRAHAAYRLAATSVKESDLDDLVQEAWMVLLLKKDEVDFPMQGTRAALLAYLGKVLLNKANNLLRRELRRRTQHGSQVDDGGKPTAGMSEMAVTTARAMRNAEQQEATVLVARAMSALSEEDREIVMSRLFEGLGNQAIGEAIGLEPNTVAQRYKRALNALRDAIGPEHGQILEDLVND